MCYSIICRKYYIQEGNVPTITMNVKASERYPVKCMYTIYLLDTICMVALVLEEFKGMPQWGQNFYFLRLNFRL